MSLIVSHRSSTVRMAELIVVLDGGCVRETGSHAELLAHGGLNAGLYELQGPPGTRHGGCRNDRGHVDASPADARLVGSWSAPGSSTSR